MRYLNAVGRVLVFSLLGCLATPGLLWAQDFEDELAEMGALGDLDLDALLSLDLTVTSATKFEQTVSEAPAIISVITAKQIQARGYQSVADALQSVPGLYVNTDWVSPDVGVRGVSGGLRGGSRVIKVMINSQPVSFRIETTNWLGPEFIPLKAIERIEVIKITPQIYSDEAVTDVIVPNRTSIDSWTLVGVTAGVSSDEWSAELYIDNLTDERAEISGNNVFSEGRIMIVRPRTMGLRVSWDI